LPVTFLYIFYKLFTKKLITTNLENNNKQDYNKREKDKTISILLIKALQNIKIAKINL